MGWVPVVVGEHLERAFITHSQRPRRTKFLVDENLGEETALELQEVYGANVEFAGDVGLQGKDDGAVLSYAWRKGLVLLTHDRGFLDDSKFPENRNPGIVILPGGSGEIDPLLDGIDIAMGLVGEDPMRWRGSKITIGANGEATIKERNERTGAMKIRRYRIPESGPVLIWMDD